MKRVVIFTTLLALSLAASTATAGGMYFGFGVGNTFFSSEYTDALDQIKKIDENSTAWKAFGGFNSDSFFSVEGGYRDFGKIESGSGDDLVTSKTSGWDIEAIGRLQIAIVDIFGKAGIMFWNSEATLGNQSDEGDGTDFMWGLGAGVHLGPFGVRLEWESLEVGGPDNLSMVSLSGTLGF